MPTFIITGNYTAEGLRGMMANPSDRGAAVRGLIEASGGRMISYYATTGAFDFHIVAEGRDAASTLAAVMAAGASGGAANLQTSLAFSSDEFTSLQAAAGKVASAYKATNAR